MTSYGSSSIVSILVLVMMLASPAHSAPCNSSCGNINNIGFPFSLNNSDSGVDPSCPSTYMNNPYLQLFCNHTEGKLYALHQISNFTPLEVISIHNDSLIVRIADGNMGLAIMIPENSGCSDSPKTDIMLPPVGTGPYVISDENKFGSFGCTMAILSTTDLMDLTSNDSLLDYSDHVSVGGCSVLLPNNQNINDCANNNDCANRSCVASLPLVSDLHLRYASYTTTNNLIVTQVSSLAPGPECSCSNNYATLFHPQATDFDNRLYRIKITWALPVILNATTSDPTSLERETELNDAIMESPDYACTRDQRSEFVAVPEVQGYRCKCKDGFAGDGYANGTGCINIDECAIPSLNACVSQATCVDTFGNYMCTCNSRFNVGDGRKDGLGCKLSPWIRKIIIILPACLGFLIVMVIIMVLLMFWSKRIKRKNFMQNGGLQLQEFLKSKGHDHTLVRIFSGLELNAATNNYADNMKIGTGGFGVVYKGKLENGKLVAIKKPLLQGDGDNKEFLNEVIILTQIHHKHIVKLLGCCLETRIPLLVYEYASNGTLGDHLQESSNDNYLMRWDRRLLVAIQTAEALSYLHRAASPPILHRDVKSTNILIDEQWNAKVGDFGVSRLVPNGGQEISTVVQGTLGYLDPEYFQTLQLTDKSDVYSMGVMLVELITSLKPVDNRHRDPQFSNLALLFIHHMKAGILKDIIDPRFEVDNDSMSISSKEGHRIRSSIFSVASIAYRCLALAGCDRPSMIEVAHDLQEISDILHATRTKDVTKGSFGESASTLENIE